MDVSSAFFSRICLGLEEGHRPKPPPSQLPGAEAMINGITVLYCGESDKTFGEED